MFCRFGNRISDCHILFPTAIPVSGCHIRYLAAIPVPVSGRISIGYKNGRISSAYLLNLLIQWGWKTNSGRTVGFFLSPKFYIYYLHFYTVFVLRIKQVHSGLSVFQLFLTGYIVPAANSFIPGLLYIHFPTEFCKGSTIQSVPSFFVP